MARRRHGRQGSRRRRSKSPTGLRGILLRPQYPLTGPASPRDVSFICAGKRTQRGGCGASLASEARRLRPPPPCGEGYRVGVRSTPTDPDCLFLIKSDRGSAAVPPPLTPHHKGEGGVGAVPTP